MPMNNDNVQQNYSFVSYNRAQFKQIQTDKMKKYQKITKICIY